MNYKSVLTALAASEFCHQNHEYGYCQSSIDGQPHVVEFRLVAGYSDRDHLATESIVAMIRSVADKNFATIKSLKSTARKAAHAANPGGPRINIITTPGTVQEKHQRENIAKCDAMVRKNWPDVEIEKIRHDADAFVRESGELTRKVKREYHGTYISANGRTGTTITAICGISEFSEPDAEWETKN
jgi:hypothetical protein